MDLPSNEEIESKLDAWKGFIHSIQQRISEIEEERKRKGIEEEKKNYRRETSDQRLKRARKLEEWVSIPLPNRNLGPGDLLCLNSDTCWYEGNLDRIDEIKSNYRLKGTDNVYLCDQCISDDVFEHFQVEEAIRDSIEKVEEEEEEEKEDGEGK